jgi:hypothetical protein
MLLTIKCLERDSLLHRDDSTYPVLATLELEKARASVHITFMDFEDTVA